MSLRPDTRPLSTDWCETALIRPAGRPKTSVRSQPRSERSARCQSSYPSSANRSRHLDVAYFDSSALVKLVIVEDGSDHAAALRDRSDAVIRASSRTSKFEPPSVQPTATNDSAPASTDRRRAAGSGSGLDVGPRADNTTDRARGRPRRGLRTSSLRRRTSASALALGSTSVVVVSWDTRMRSGARSPQASRSRLLRRSDVHNAASGNVFGGRPEFGLRFQDARRPCIHLAGARPPSDVTASQSALHSLHSLPSRSPRRRPA